MIKVFFEYVGKSVHVDSVKRRKCVSRISTSYSIFLWWTDPCTGNLKHLERVALSAFSFPVHGSVHHRKTSYSVNILYIGTLEVS